MHSRRNKRVLPALAALVLVAAGAALFAEYRHEQNKLVMRAEALTGGNVANGRLAFAAYGCGGCHSVGSVPGARGLVGPPLEGIASRAIIAGRLQNSPSNLMRWIGDPQAVSPGTAMPWLGVSPRDQRDIAAFLYTRP